MVAILLIAITLINPSIARAESLEGGKNQGITSQEILTVLQRIQSDTSENLRSMQSAITESLRSMQSATSMNIQTVISAISKQSSNTDANLVNIIDAVESLGRETHTWRNELSETIVNIFNQTMNMIVKNNELNGISSLKETLVKTNEVLTDIQNNSRNSFTTQANEISLLKETLDKTNNVLAEIKNSSVCTLDRDSSGISLLNKTFTEITNALTGIKNRITSIAHTGFTDYNGHIVLLPRALGGTTLNWPSSINRCSEYGAVPFIPRTIDDFRYIQRVNSDIGSGRGMWLPASDQESEGTIKWHDGSDAAATLRLFDWYDGYAGDNEEYVDCVNIWTNFANKVEMVSCTQYELWPMICEIL